MKLLTSIEEVKNQYADRIDQIFNEVNLNQEDLKKVNDKYRNGDIIGACEELLSYYSNNFDLSWVDYTPQMLPVLDPKKELEDLKEDKFTFQLVNAKVPRLANGHLDWKYLGPNNDKEFGWALNRHHFLNILVFDYIETKNEEDVILFNRLIQDWLIANPCPSSKTRSPQWRALEAALRAMWIWPFCFYGFLNSPNFSPATRLLMLSSLIDHAYYLKANYVRGGNIRVMQLNSLATIAAMWPQFRNSKDWAEYSLKILTPELQKSQVYPDGIQKELTSHYHRVALVNFEHSMKMAKKLSIPIPDRYEEIVEKMWNYLAYTIRPDGYGLLNNDSDQDDNREWVLNAAKQYNREDWKYIITNGDQGKAPASISFLSPWAGHLISRQSFKKESLWSFFDFGPLGTGHWHRDKNHLSVYAHGKDFLVDGGRFRYVRDKWRYKYFKSTPSHNTILIDNKPQMVYKLRSKKPIPSNRYEINELYDYAIGIHKAEYVRNPLKRILNKIIHIRSFIFIKEGFWVILDRLETRGIPFIKINSTFQALWHFNPESSITREKEVIKGSIKEAGNLSIIPINITPVLKSIKTIKGQEDPYIQGWWSREYNHKEPNNCVIYEGKAKSSVIFGWILYPWKDKIPEIQSEIVSINEKTGNMTLNLNINSNSYNLSAKLGYKSLKSHDLSPIELVIN